MNLSAVKDIHWFVVRPVKKGAILTKADQKALKQMVLWVRPQFVAIHFLTKEREAVADRIKAAKLSKEMVVTEVTDAQWGRRFKDVETIEGTGIRATKGQLAKSFTIGKEVA